MLRYRGTFANYVSNTLGKIVRISGDIKRCCRWVIERTFSWFNGYRRLIKDYEYSISSTKSFVYIAHSMTLRLVR